MFAKIQEIDCTFASSKARGVGNLLHLVLNSATDCGLVGFKLFQQHLFNGKLVLFTDVKPRSLEKLVGDRLISTVRPAVQPQSSKRECGQSVKSRWSDDART